MIVRNLPNGSTVRRDDGKLYLYDANGNNKGEIERGGQAALILGIGPEDFGDTPVQSSPTIVSGPAERKRAPWYKRWRDIAKF